METATKIINWTKINSKAVLIAIAIIFVLWIVFTWNVSINEDYLYGYWTAEDDDFCEDSDISSMLLFIGEPNAGWRSSQRTGYIIIMNDLCNQGFTLDYTRGWSSISLNKYHIKANVQFDEEDIWPECVDIEIDISMGTLRIYSEDVIYAQLTKNHDVTNICRDLESAQIILEE